MTACCEHGNECSGSPKGRESVDLLSDLLVSQKGPAPCKYVLKLSSQMYK